jgi:hypothetical protein
MENIIYFKVYVYGMKKYTNFIGQDTTGLDNYGKLQMILDSYAHKKLTAVVLSIQDRDSKAQSTIEHALCSMYENELDSVLHFDNSGYTDFFIKSPERLEEIALFLYSIIKKPIGCVVCNGYEDALDVQFKAGLAIEKAKEKGKKYHIYQPEDASLA